MIIIEKEATGIIRKFDDIGRIQIPKEIRRKLGLSREDSLEVFITNDKGIYLQKTEEKESIQIPKELFENMVEIFTGSSENFEKEKNKISKKILKINDNINFFNGGL